MVNGRTSANGLHQAAFLEKLNRTRTGICRARCGPSPVWVASVVTHTRLRIDSDKMNCGEEPVQPTTEGSTRKGQKLAAGTACRAPTTLCGKKLATGPQLGRLHRYLGSATNRVCGILRAAVTDKLPSTGLENSFRRPPRRKRQRNDLYSDQGHSHSGWQPCTRGLLHPWADHLLADASHPGAVQYPGAHCYFRELMLPRRSCYPDGGKIEDSCQPTLSPDTPLIEDKPRFVALDCGHRR